MPGETSKRFLNFQNEYEAVRNSAALFNFSPYGKISVKGKDRVKFLQGITSNDISTLAEGSSLYTLFPTVKGKIASEGRVCAYPDHLLVILHPDLREKTLLILKKFKIGSDAQLEDLTEKFSLFSVQGPRSGEVLRKLIQEAILDLLPFHFKSFLIGNVPVEVHRNDWTGEMGFDLLIPSPHGEIFSAKLLEIGSPLGLTSASAETFETIRVESGIPIYGKELSEEILPQEAGLEKTAVSYTKGCYIGQETIARLHYLGHANRALTGFFSDQVILEKNASIYSGDKNIGRITSSLYSPFLRRGISLGYLNRQFLEPGTTVEIGLPNGNIKAEVTSLPFYKHHEKKVV